MSRIEPREVCSKMTTISMSTLRDRRIRIFVGPRRVGQEGTRQETRADWQGKKRLGYK